jgi:hypothetical protein
MVPETGDLAITAVREVRGQDKIQRYQEVRRGRKKKQRGYRAPPPFGSWPGRTNKSGLCAKLKEEVPDLN